MWEKKKTFSTGIDNLSNSEKAVFISADRFRLG